MSTPTVKELKDTIKKINNIIRVMDRKSVIGEDAREDYFWTNHADIMNRYPFLVSTLCRGGDTKMLDQMINQLSNIENGKTDMDKADINIGKQLAKKYLPDNNS